MIYLDTDDQTIEDLRIFGKRNEGGIYDLYNRTHTRGGESVLRTMFANPLSDPEAINRRSSIIAWFAGRNVRFPFDAALIDLVEKYLADTEGDGGNTSRQHILGEKEIREGAISVIKFIQDMNEFMAGQESGGTHFSAERDAAQALLKDPALAPVFAEKKANRLSFTAISAYNTLFRQRECEKLKALLAHVYHLDVYLSVAKIAAERKLIFPNALGKSGGALTLTGVYHPELENAVANDLKMMPGQNVTFLTGANMAGKSTFLRAVSVAVYTAHIGFPVAAKAMDFSVMDGIYTTINLPDNLGIGASHFYNEVLRVKKISLALNQGKCLFVIFDELFRGTNVKDANEATVAVTAAFAKKNKSMFIISSHIVEAGEELRKHSTIGFRFLPTRMNGHQPEYTYTLEEGITDDRHGMIIIRNEGILDILKKGREQRLQPA